MGCRRSEEEPLCLLFSCQNSFSFYLLFDTYKKKTHRSFGANNSDASATMSLSFFFLLLRERTDEIMHIRRSPSIFFPFSFPYNLANTHTRAHIYREEKKKATIEALLVNKVSID
jgi:hypothetical protein